LRIAMMEKNKEFAVLVGRAFLQEIEAGHKESAVAFGRAFLLSLGMKGPEENETSSFAKGKHFEEHLVLVQN
jgi:hypothetical protein